jgi:hypothetical protein
MVRVIECRTGRGSGSYREAGREAWGPIRLVTDMLDPARAPAGKLAELYLRNMDPAAGRLYGMFNGSLLLSTTVIRSRNPDLVVQDVLGLVITHYTLQSSIARAAARSGLDPDGSEVKDPGSGMKRKRWPTASAPGVDVQVGEGERD